MENSIFGLEIFDHSCMNNKTMSSVNRKNEGRTL